MQITKQGFGIVMKADGTVPFDEDVHPDHRAAILAHLIETGHNLKVDQETKVVTIKSGPMIDQRDKGKTVA